MDIDISEYDKIYVYASLKNIANTCSLRYRLDNEIVSLEPGVVDESEYSNIKVEIFSAFGTANPKGTVSAVIVLGEEIEAL